MTAMSESVPSSSFQRSSGRRPRILFVNDLWGYGTVTMAMAVAEQLHDRAICRFAGQGPGFELARRDCFDDLLRGDTMAEPILPALDAAIRASDAVVVVLNRAVARRAAELAVPCLYLDCMLWMWTQPPALPATVRYVTENFPGTAGRLELWRDRLPGGEIVGPLVVRPRRERAESANAVLINFGGLSCNLLDQDVLLAYASTMARCALAAVGESASRVIIAAGQHVLGLMDRDVLRAITPDVDLVDLSHDAYLAELRRSRVLISSSGLHALYEACALGVPCVCLPPQNLSGALVLDELERAGVQRALSWNQLYGLEGLEAADEPDACRRIAECVYRFRADEVAQQRLVDDLRERIQPACLAQVQQRQSAFFAAQGDYGAPTVADRVLELLETPAPAAAH
jgi:UDP:flavonoid glycosyltransferase YjiC (YdhE family)